MERTLSDYALIGNCRSAALVSRYGSIDWCCMPEFDSPSIFAAIIDEAKGGHFYIRPAKAYQSTQTYTRDTNVLETLFTTDEGQVRLTDAFTAMTEDEKQHVLFPDHEILRMVEGISGSVSMEVAFTPRNYYGKHIPALKDADKLGIQFFRKENIFTLLTTLRAGSLRVAPDNSGHATGSFDLDAGERIFFSLSHSSQSPCVLPELRESALQRMQKTITFWQHWMQQCTYAGLYANEVKRSALVLKLLTYAPSGAIIAAPTTSLPEETGGVRNWDYRYCWLRDASFTTRVLINLGFKKEAEAYMQWILHATRLTQPRLQVVYSVFGEAHLHEEILPWLSGFKGSQPVRIGNKADAQFQLDVYGEVLDAIYTFAPLIKKLDGETKHFLIGLAKVVCQIWNQPDQGIWEIRSDGVHHTHSKVMAWVALDRISKLSKLYGWTDAPLNKFTETAERIRSTVDQSGYDPDQKSYTGELHGRSLDASVLTFSLVGYTPATSDKMVSTTAAIADHLSKNNLVYRYRHNKDGLPGEEGAFGVCSFWLAENLAKSGNIRKAMDVFDTMVRHASPTGLLSEEINPDTGELQGNYPQGFTHIGLINAALTLNEAFEDNGLKYDDGSKSSKR